MTYTAHFSYEVQVMLLAVVTTSAHTLHPH